MTVYTYNKQGEIIDEQLTETYPRDAHGRVDIRHMSNRALLVEAVVSMRATQDTVKAFIDQMSNNPVMRTMAGVFGKR